MAGFNVGGMELEIVSIIIGVVIGYLLGYTSGRRSAMMMGI